MKRVWQTLSSSVVFSRNWLRVICDEVIRPDGELGSYVYIEKNGGNFIIAFDGTCIYMIKEYKYPIKDFNLQLPAGVLEDDNVFEGAKKELDEETGIIAKEWKKLGSFYVAPGHETTQVNVILARDLDVSNLRLDNQEGDESICQIIKMSISDVKQSILNGDMFCGPSLAALNLFFLWLEK